MTKEELIKFWKAMLENRVLLSPSIKFAIEQTIKYLEGR